MERQEGLFLQSLAFKQTSGSKQGWVWRGTPRDALPLSACIHKAEQQQEAVSVFLILQFSSDQTSSLCWAASFRRALSGSYSRNCSSLPVVGALHSAGGRTG